MAKKSKEAGRISHAKASQKWRDKNKIKRNAQSVIQYHIKKGTMKKQPCENCGALDTQAHHDDYKRAMLVRWLCLECHGKFHKEHEYDSKNFNYRRKK